ncbi:MAG TPA: ABC transporter permease [Gemmataceae bacterium]|nr:ABC transporter permease [Gemmataceae bacterium]
MTSPTTSSSASRSAWQALLRLLQRTECGLVAAIVAVVLLAAAVDTQHTYFTRPGDSAINVLRQTALLGIFALGAAVVIIAGGIDLSSGSVIAFSGTVCGLVMLQLAPDQMKQGLPVGMPVMAAAIVATLVVGFLIGSLHSWLITMIGLPPFVATLATLVGLRSLGRALVAHYTGGSSQIQIFDNQFRYLATSVWVPVVLFVVLAALVWLLMARTVVGRHLYALGGNENAARLSGIRTDGLKWLAYSLSAMLSAVAGILYICEVATADPEKLGKGYELNAIAAAVVGGCSLTGGAGTIPGTVLGVLFLRVVIDGVAKIIKRSADIYEGLIVGIVVVVAVAFTQVRQTGGRGRRFFGGPLGIVTIVNLAVMAALLATLFGEDYHVDGKIVGAVALVVLILGRFFEGRSGAVKPP